MFPRPCTWRVNSGGLVSTDARYGGKQASTDCEIDDSVGVTGCEAACAKLVNGVVLWDNAGDGGGGMSSSSGGGGGGVCTGGGGSTRVVYVRNLALSNTYLPFPFRDDSGSGTGLSVLPVLRGPVGIGLKPITIRDAVPFAGGSGNGVL